MMFSFLIIKDFRSTAFHNSAVMTSDLAKVCDNEIVKGQKCPSLLKSF